MPVDPYDAGLLNDYGGGDVDWWLDYIRKLLSDSHDHYSAQIEGLEAELHSMRNLHVEKKMASLLKYTSHDIFRKWYKVIWRKAGRCGYCTNPTDGHYWVVRADKQETGSAGTYIGPVRSSGRNYHDKAQEEAYSRNQRILHKRAVYANKLRAKGWSDEGIRKLQALAREKVRKEMGQDYKEE